MKIKTGTRNVKQSFRKFTDEQKREIIRQVDNRPSNVQKTEMFRRLGLNKGNLYYLWKEKFGMDKITKRETKPVIVHMNKITNVKTSGMKLHVVTLSVEVGSIMELIGFCNDIVKIPKVKSVLSVE